MHIKKYMNMRISKLFLENKLAHKGGSGLEYVDCVAVVFREKIKNSGEDSFCYSVCENKTMLGVFDGCGGSGAKIYPAFGNKSGAYMASRAAAGATKNWFKQIYMHSDSDLAECANTLKASINTGLAICKQNCGMNAASKMKGSLFKEFPTTAALTVCRSEGEEISADIFWAGDSRVYLLDSTGLAQLTADDLSGGIDAYENISSDAVLTNVINASSDFIIHSRRVPLNMPCVVFCASDGCFGYISSPMEFEFMLLDTLYHASSVTEWENAVGSYLADTSGDDYTLVAGLFGYGSFDALKESLRGRTEDVYYDYIKPLRSNDADWPDELWYKYRESYYRFS